VLSLSIDNDVPENKDTGLSLKIKQLLTAIMVSFKKIIMIKVEKIKIN
jgi:hypothetical protein